MSDFLFCNSRAIWKCQKIKNLKIITPLFIFPDYGAYDYYGAYGSGYGGYGYDAYGGYGDGAYGGEFILSFFTSDPSEFVPSVFPNAMGTVI